MDGSEVDGSEVDGSEVDGSEVEGSGDVGDLWIAGVMECCGDCTGVFWHNYSSWLGY